MLHLPYNNSTPYSNFHEMGNQVKFFKKKKCSTVCFFLNVAEGKQGISKHNVTFGTNFSWRRRSRKPCGETITAMR